MDDRVRAGWLLVLALAGAPAILAGEDRLPPAAAPPGPRSLAAAGPADPARFLAGFARAWVEGRSGEVVFVPKPGVFFTEAGRGYNHGSPWEYDTRIPLVFYGPGQVGPATIRGESREPVGQPYDIAPTLAAAVDLAAPSSMQGHAWTGILSPGRPSPKALLVVVMDQVGAADLARFADRMPTLERWKREGANFPTARLDYLPAVTAVSHACVGTGAPPSVHGINNNLLPDPSRTRLEVVIRAGESKVDPAMLRAPTLAEVLDQAHGNRAVIIAQVYAEYAAVGLAGQGSLRPGGDRDVVVWYDSRTGRAITDARYYRIPDYLGARSTRTLLDTYGSTYMGNPVGDFYRIKESPRFARWEADNVLTMMAREGVGADAIPDLVLVNLKSTDAIGHAYGHDVPGFADCLAEIDRFLGAAERMLTRRTGPGGFLAAVTADHGLVPPDGKRRVQAELVAAMGTRLAERGRPGPSPVIDIEGYHVFVDRKVLANRGLTLGDVKQALAADPDVLMAWTADEVRASPGLAR